MAQSISLSQFEELKKALSDLSKLSTVEFEELLKNATPDWVRQTIEVASKKKKKKGGRKSKKRKEQEVNEDLEKSESSFHAFFMTQIMYPYVFISFSLTIFEYLFSF